MYQSREETRKEIKERRTSKGDKKKTRKVSREWKQGRKTRKGNKKKKQEKETWKGSKD